MFPGESGPVTFRFPTSIAGEVMDWFGAYIFFFDKSEDQVTARAEVKLASMRRWASSPRMFRTWMARCSRSTTGSIVRRENMEAVLCVLRRVLFSKYFC